MAKNFEGVLVLSGRQGLLWENIGFLAATRSHLEHEGYHNQMKIKYNEFTPQINVHVRKDVYQYSYKIYGT